MRAVEEGGREWRETQSKLRLRRDAMRAHAERTNPRNLLSRARADNVDVEIDHGHDREPAYFGNYNYINYPTRTVLPATWKASNPSSGMWRKEKGTTGSRSSTVETLVAS